MKLMLGISENETEPISEAISKASMELARQREEYVKSKVRETWFRFPLKYLVRYFLTLQTCRGWDWDSFSPLALSEEINIVCRYRKLEWLFFKKREEGGKK